MCHTEELCKKATNKTKALFRIQPYLTLERAKGLYHAYILSTFKKFQIIPATSLDLEVDYVYHLKTVTYGIRSLKFMGYLLWNPLPKIIKDSATFNRIKNWLKS